MLAALNHVVKNGMADPNKVSVMGGSHGGFLASHLLGQVSKYRVFLSLPIDDEFLAWLDLSGFGC